MRSLLCQIQRPLLGAQGPVGQVTDMYFDDETWDVLWFVVRRLPPGSGEAILIPPEDLELDVQRLPGLRLRQPEMALEHYPVASSRLPISLQRLDRLSQTMVWASSPFPMIFQAPETAASASPHLRSCRHVKTYDLWVRKRRLGRIDDFLWDPKSSRIVAFRVRRGWRRRLGPLVLAGPGTRVSWLEFRVYADGT